MKKIKNFVFLLVITALLTPLASAEQPYVITNSGNKVTGKNIKADADGNLTLETESGEMTFSAGNYKKAYKPRPDAVSELYELFQNNDYEQVIKYAPQTMQKYKLVGWGDMIAYMHSTALLEKGEAKEALRVVRRGEDYVRNYEDLLFKAKVRALKELREFEKAKELLKKLIENAESKTAASAFNIRGSILEKEGKKKQAVLEYLKTVLLFQPEEAKAQREKARKKAVQLLEEMNDPRVDKIRELK